ncbi:MAG TPA: hypothetical protein VK083_11530 [Nocardia sp.]|uniref:hypothetical protein n=1 Tax=Nocardia TaxID=1817 RepID=UPI0024561009|nr:MULTISPECIES: hypothetical protein [Nocardia]HLS77412.1 hypothetical protein [Nocardia sp.]
MTRFLAVLAGALLTAAVALVYLPAAAPAAVLVVLGWWFRAAAVAAVLLALAVLSFASGVGAVEAAATGLVATAYLLNAAAVSAPHGVVPTSLPSVLGALGFTAVAAAAALLPLDLAWVPALAPIAVIAVYFLVVTALAPRRKSVRKPEGPAVR